ncbi:Kelch-like protein 2 [Platysternon megacephalum]|uniref:Kelch-like protein 2 n=1 Tax=Platysternon megacephalum TaxID=55544 RepID=A0A4D9EZY7_9SAUR|nr:Kelch-like protein 2 [Platysternon megacephalum]
MEMLLPPVCTKLCHQKPVDLKDDNTEKHCPVTVNPWHMKKAFKVMNELRSQNLLCDVTIVAEDMEIAAHRVVLAACSPYFHAMFTGEMSESRAKRVRIKEVDGWTLRMLIDYVYTAEIQVTEENVQACIAGGLKKLVKQEIKYQTVNELLSVKRMLTKSPLQDQSIIVMEVIEDKGYSDTVEEDSLYE